MIIGLTLSIAILFVLLTGNKLYTVFFTPAHNAANNTKLMQQMQDSSSGNNTDYGAAITTLNIFGKMSSPVVRQQQKIGITRLKLTLKGIVASNTKRSALAIISKGNGRESAFKINEALPSGAKLKGIYSDHIIIEHAGKLERLPLKRPEIAIPN